MNQEKIGKFILKIRKKHQMTQQEFADKLGVTFQAVSKWENGRGIPDIEMLKTISKEFKVDIEELLEGEEKSKVVKYKKYIIALSLFIVIFLTLFFIIGKNKDYEFFGISSKHELFTVNGVVIYSKDKKSIYISSISYTDEKGKDDKYTFVECSLHETNKDIDKVIDTCESINNIGNDDEPQTLSEFLKIVEFSLHDYSSTCKMLTSDNLYISINAVDLNNKNITYKIPIKLEDKCHE